MPAAATPSPRPRRIRRWLIAGGIAIVALCLAAGAVSAALVAERLTTKHYRFDGDSMAPCFPNQATVTVRSLDDAERRALRHGDIVVFAPPVNTAKPYLKRIVAIGGDEIAIRNGQVLINGTAITEPYIAQPALYRYPLAGTGEATTIPAGMVFVLGDNRNNSADSYVFGPVSRDRVTHKVTTPCQGQPAQP